MALSSAAEAVFQPLFVEREEAQAWEWSCESKLRQLLAEKVAARLKSIIQRASDVYALFSSEMRLVQCFRQFEIHSLKTDVQSTSLRFLLISIFFV